MRNVFGNVAFVITAAIDFMCSIDRSPSVDVIFKKSSKIFSQLGDTGLESWGRDFPYLKTKPNPPPHSWHELLGLFHPSEPADLDHQMCRLLRPSQDGMIHALDVFYSR